MGCAYRDELRSAMDYYFILFPYTKWSEQMSNKVRVVRTNQIIPLFSAVVSMSSKWPKQIRFFHSSGVYICEVFLIRG